MYNEEIIERFDNYLHGRLSSDEHAAFEQELADNSTLSKAFEDHKTMVAALETDQLMKSIRQDLDDVGSHADASAKPAPGSNRIWIMGLLALLVIGGAYMGWKMFNVPDTPQAHYAQYYAPDPGLPTPMGPAEDYEFTTGMVHFKIGEYDRAIQLWQALSEDHPDNVEYKYYLAMAYQADGDVDKSAPLLHQVINHPTGQAYQDKARWFLALLELKSGDTQAAIQHLALTNYHKSKELLTTLTNE